MTNESASDLPKPELSRIVKISEIGSAPVKGEIIADQDECDALAQRFDLPEISSLSATYALEAGDQDIGFTGTIHSKLHQYCSVSGAAFPVTVSEDFYIAFTKKSDEPPAQDHGDEGIELAEEDCDLIEYQGSQIDLGEAVAQTLYLALDPYPRGPDADNIAAKKGLKTEEEAGPFGALAGLKDKLDKKS